MLLKWSCRTVFNGIKIVSTNVSVRWNHYKVLGLTPSAKLSDIKAAYYKLSKIHHPDRNNGSPASAKKFRDIVAAYEILSKPDSRRNYDREIIKSFDSGTSDFAPRKKVTKRGKKTSNASKIKSSQIKNEIRSKPKHRSSGKVNRDVMRKKNGDFETFIVRAIPIVIACILCCKKR